jgi:hypothetical protein
MFAVHTWSGQRLATQHDATLLLYSELGGTFLGKLVVPKRFEGLDIFGVLKDLQVQAHKLMRHEWRSSRDVLLKLDNYLLLPFGFGFKQTLDLDDQHKALASLHDALANKKKVFMRYDDTDEYATHEVKRCGIDLVYREDSITIIFSFTFPTCCAELATLVARQKATHVFCRHERDAGCGNMVDLAFMEGLVTKASLHLQSVTPTSWEPLVHISSLYINRAPIHATNIKCLSSLRVLDVYGQQCVVPDEIQDLDLHEARFENIAVDPRRLVELLQNMSNLSCLEIVHFHTLWPIPLNVANLTNLTRLRMTDSVTGSVPTELARLTKLTHLEISGPDDWFDANIPEELLDLNLDELMVGHT